MRPRFLVTDCFNSHQSPTPPFHCLPIPQVPSPPKHLSSSAFDLFSDDHRELLRCISVLPSVSLQLPIDDALSKFLSDVLPHTIDAGNHADFLMYQSCRAAEGSAVGSEEENIIFVEKDGNELQLVHFEAPEPRFMVDNGTFEKADMQNLLDKFKCENTLGTTDQDLIFPSLHEVKESVYAVEDISFQCSLDKKLDFLDDTDSSTSKSDNCDGSFPLLEVDDIFMGNDTSLDLKDQILILLETIEVQHNGENDIEINCRGLLGCAEIDILSCISEHCLPKLSLELLSDSLSFFAEIDLSHLIEAPYREENDGSFSMAPEDHCVPLAELPGPCEDFIMLDVDPLSISEVFSYFQRADEIKTRDPSFLEEMKFKSFEDLIVSHELTLADNSFKSLPIPVIVDDEREWSLHTHAANILSGLDGFPLSSFDEIYLDWHLLGKDKCNCDMGSTCQKLFSDIDPYSIELAILSNSDSIELLDPVSSGDDLRWLDKEDRLNMMSSESCVLSEHGGTGSFILPNTDHVTLETVKKSTGMDSKTQPPSVNCGSKFNDLEFFLNPREPTAGMGLGSNIEVRVSNTKAQLPSGLHMGAFHPASGLLLDAYVHDINLSDNILILLNIFQKKYMASFDDYLQLTNTGSSAKVIKETDVIGFTEEKLLECIRMVEQNYSIDPGGNIFMTVGVLCAIKRMSWCLSFYGIHALHEFIDKLFQNLEFLRSRLSSLQSSVVNAYQMVSKELTKLHPALALIEEILLPISGKKQKVLIVADVVLWWPLKLLLGSMNMSITEVKNSAMNENLPAACRMDVTVQTDCFLAPHDYISTSLALNKFDVVLEYGGPHGSSKVSTILPKSYLQHHFLKVELVGVAKALCEGVGTALDGKFTMKLEELLDFSFIMEKFNSVSVEAARTMSYKCMTVPFNCSPWGSKTKGPGDSSFPGAIVIVNTQNFQKEMIISRRSTYRSILTMEKNGVHVAERDLVLPIDMIISASMCLAWYDCRNIGKKATMPDEASSSIPLCVDNIAANVLTSLSFTFSSCILVFEGESDFLDTVMESSDVLYAAAASLGIDLQIFFSYSSDLTEEIILSCIRGVMKLTEGLLPKLPESETLAESFLTEFPSINPLAAHAILSTVRYLVGLFEWSHECRKRALQKYLVAEEAVSLLSVLCRYGELEESKSGTTDCSSSVSSAPTSKTLECKFTFERKKQKTAQSPRDANCLEDTDMYLDGIMHYPAESEPVDFIIPRLSDKRKLADIPLVDELFDEEVGANALQSSGPKVGGQYVTCVLKGPQMRNYVGGSSLPSSSRYSGRVQKLGITPSIKLDMHGSSLFQDLDRELIGEVIDIEDESLLGKGFPSFARSAKYFPSVPEIDEKMWPKEYKTARRLSFENYSHPDFHQEATKTSDCIMRSQIKNVRHETVGNYYVGEGDYRNIESSMHNSIDQSRRNLVGQLPEGKSTSPYGATPLSEAIYLGQVQQGSPWTIECANHVREKSRLSRLPLPGISPVPAPAYPGSATKAMKRKSSSVLEQHYKQKRGRAPGTLTERKDPSVVEYYRHQGGCAPGKLIEYLKHQGGCAPGKVREWKRQNQFSEPFSAKKGEDSASPLRGWTPLDTKAANNEETSASLLRAWTPLDKRARQALSFTTGGNGGQTKLVWGSKHFNA